jgi:hypothetical protein
MPLFDREEERRPPVLNLKIELTASCNELLRDGLTPLLGRYVER